MANLIDINLDELAGKSSEEIVAILKKRREEAAAAQGMRETYDSLGITTTKDTGKIMVKLPGSYPIVQTFKGWKALEALMPMILKAHKDLGVGEENDKEKAA